MKIKIDLRTHPVHDIINRLNNVENIMNIDVIQKIQEINSIEDLDKISLQEAIIFRTSLLDQNRNLRNMYAAPKYTPFRQLFNYINTNPRVENDYT